MKRLGMPASDDTILRHLKRQVATPREHDCTGGRHRRLELAKGSRLRDHHHRPGEREVVDVLVDCTTIGTANMRETIETQLSRADRATGRALCPNPTMKTERRSHVVRAVDATRRRIDT